MHPQSRSLVLRAYAASNLSMVGARGGHAGSCAQVVYCGRRRFIDSSLARTQQQQQQPDSTTATTSPSPSSTTTKQISSSSNISSNSDPNSDTTQQQQQQQQQPPPPNKPRANQKSQAQLDAELQAKMAGLSGDGGEAGIEYEDGQPVAMKRGVRNNMFRYI